VSLSFISLKEMIEQGKIKPIFDKIYPIEQAAQAYTRVVNEQRLGPVVLSFEKN
jgi:D-arabinose 1-dehydrogenase-like Zn-dependent alcohol dehydrogenase